MDRSFDTPELRAFLESLSWGELLSGTVAAIERFGVFVALDRGPEHPLFPGVGFIAIPELSWRRFAAATEIVQVGKRVTCAFLQFDTWNMEARLSLRATHPDPFKLFADRVAVGDELSGRITVVVPFGVFVRVADGVEGLIHQPNPTSMMPGDELSVVVTGVDRERRQLALRKSE